MASDTRRVWSHMLKKTLFFVLLESHPVRAIWKRDTYNKLYEKKQQENEYIQPLNWVRVSKRVERQARVRQQPKSIVRWF